jgi:hypothetical protein
MNHLRKASVLLQSSLGEDAARSLSAAQPSSAPTPTLSRKKRMTAAVHTVMKTISLASASRSRVEHRADVSERLVRVTALRKAQNALIADCHAELERLHAASGDGSSATLRRPLIVPLLTDVTPDGISDAAMESALVSRLDELRAARKQLTVSRAAAAAALGDAVAATSESRNSVHRSKSGDDPMLLPGTATVYAELAATSAPASSAPATASTSSTEGTASAPGAAPPRPPPPPLPPLGGSSRRGSRRGSSMGGGGPRKRRASLIEIAVVQEDQHQRLDQSKYQLRYKRQLKRIEEAELEMEETVVLFMAQRALLCVAETAELITALERAHTAAGNGDELVRLRAKVAEQRLMLEAATRASGGGSGASEGSTTPIPRLPRAAPVRPQRPARSGR